MMAEENRAWISDGRCYHCHQPITKVLRQTLILRAMMWRSLEVQRYLTISQLRHHYRAIKGYTVDVTPRIKGGLQEIKCEVCSSHKWEREYSVQLSKLRHLDRIHSYSKWYGSGSNVSMSVCERNKIKSLQMKYTAHTPFFGRVLIAKKERD